MPIQTYRTLWAHVDRLLPKQDACKWMVTVLRLAYEYDCESPLGAELLREVLDGKLPDIKQVQARFLRPGGMVADHGGTTPQHALASYDELLASTGAPQPLRQEVTL